MIRTFLDSQNDSYNPNAGDQIHLTNEIGQDDFKLSACVFASSTDGAYTDQWTVRQRLMANSGEVVSEVTKVVPVSIPADATLKLIPLIIGSIPMLNVDTDKKSYRYRRTITSGKDVIEDNVTRLDFDGTDTRFGGPTVPYTEGSAGTDSTAAIAAEIAANETEITGNTAALAVSAKATADLQARNALLVRRNTALKAVPALPVPPPVAAPRWAGVLPATVVPPAAAQRRTPPPAQVLAGHAAAKH